LFGSKQSILLLVLCILATDFFFSKLSDLNLIGRNVQLLPIVKLMSELSRFVVLILPKSHLLLLFLLRATIDALQ